VLVRQMRLHQRARAYQMQAEIDRLGARPRYDQHRAAGSPATAPFVEPAEVKPGFRRRASSKAERGRGWGIEPGTGIRNRTRRHGPATDVGKSVGKSQAIRNRQAKSIDGGGAARLPPIPIFGPLPPYACNQPCPHSAAATGRRPPRAAVRLRKRAEDLKLSNAEVARRIGHPGR
jgi:hypothetical protein